MPIKTTVQKFSILLSLMLSLTLSLMSSVSFAGKGGADAGGGGLGVTSGPKVFLLDLFDNGLEATAQAPDCKVNDAFRSSLEQRSDLRQLPIRRFLCKLQVIEKREPFLAAAALEGFRALRWSFTTDRLVKTDDEGDRITRAPSVQLAFRQGDAVVIQKNLWQKMSVAHQTALIYHEIFSAFGYGVMLPSEIRRAVALAFSPDLALREQQLIEQTLTGLPTIDAVAERYPFRRENMTMILNTEYATSAPRFDQASNSFVRQALDQYIWFPQFLIHGAKSTQADIHAPVTLIMFCGDPGSRDYDDGSGEVDYDTILVTRTLTQAEATHTPALAWELKAHFVPLFSRHFGGAQPMKLCSEMSRNYMSEIESWSRSELQLSPEATHRFLNED